MSKAKIDVCTSYNEFNNLLSKARPKNSVVIAGMYNSLVNRILIGDHTKPGTKTMGKNTFVNVICQSELADLFTHSLKHFLF